MRTGTNTHAKQWFTTSLFSNVLLASSLQHPFVTTDRSWQQHLSILPLSSVCQPTLCSPQLWPPPLELALSLRSEDRTWMVAILMWSHVLRWRLVWCPCVRSWHKALCWAANQLASHPLSPSSGESMWCMSVEDFSWGWYLVENHLDTVSQLACLLVCCLPGIL